MSVFRKRFMGSKDLGAGSLVVGGHVTEAAFPGHVPVLGGDVGL